MTINPDGSQSSESAPRSPTGVFSNLALRVAEATDLIDIAEAEAPLTAAEAQAYEKIEKLNRKTVGFKHLRFTISPVGKFRRLWDMASVRSYPATLTSPAAPPTIAHSRHEQCRSIGSLWSQLCSRGCTSAPVGACSLVRGRRGVSRACAFERRLAHGAALRRALQVVMLAYTAIVSPFQVAFLEDDPVIDAADMFQVSRVQ